MIVEYKCESCEEKFDVLVKLGTEAKQKMKCKKCGKMAKKMISLSNYVMKKDGTRNKK